MHEDEPCNMNRQSAEEGGVGASMMSIEQSSQRDEKTLPSEHSIFQENLKLYLSCPEAATSSDVTMQ